MTLTAILKFYTHNGNNNQLLTAFEIIDHDQLFRLRTARNHIFLDHSVCWRRLSTPLSTLASSKTIAMRHQERENGSTQRPSGERSHLRQPIHAPENVVNPLNARFLSSESQRPTHLPPARSVRNRPQNMRREQSDHRGKFIGCSAPDARTRRTSVLQKTTAKKQSRAINVTQLFQYRLAYSRARSVKTRDAIIAACINRGTR